MTKTHKPGCYGQAISCDAKNNLCKACPFQQVCISTANMTLTILAQDRDVSSLRARVKYGDKSKKISPNVEKYLVNMSGRAKTMAISLLKQGIDVKSELHEGSNPFEDTDHCLKAPSDLLLSGSFTRPQLKQAYSATDSLKASTIEANTSTAIKVLTGLGVIEKSGNQFRLAQ